MVITLNLPILEQFVAVKTIMEEATIFSSAGGRYNKAYYGCAVAGGQFNQAGAFSATPSPRYAFIGGGQNNYATRRFTTISGGNYNFAGGAAANSGVGATVGGGIANNSSGATINQTTGAVSGVITESTAGRFSAIGGGQNNYASGHSSTIGGGRENASTSPYSMICGGFQSVADKYGQKAHGAGSFASDGDAQGSHFVLRKAVTHSTSAWHELHLDGSSAQLTIATNTVWCFTALITGATSGMTKSFGFKIDGVVENDGGTTTVKSFSVTTVDDADDTRF